MIECTKFLKERSAGTCDNVPLPKAVRIHYGLAGLEEDLPLLEDAELIM